MLTIFRRYLVMVKDLVEERTAFETKTIKENNASKKPSNNRMQTKQFKQQYNADHHYNDQA